MKSILQGLYEGEIFSDELIVPKDPEYRTARQIAREFMMYDS